MQTTSQGRNGHQTKAVVLFISLLLLLSVRKRESSPQFGSEEAIKVSFGLVCPQTKQRIRGEI